jgi:uncharacterized protein YkwD
MPSLRIEIGGQVVVARLSDAAVRVGRDPSCDLRIDDRSVSATHLTIEPLAGGGHKLTDSNSGLPTKVNGFVVKRVSLKPGDVIEVGPARIVYDPESAPAAGTPAVPPAFARPMPAPTSPFVPASPSRVPVAVTPVVPVAVASSSRTAVAEASAPASAASNSFPEPAAISESCEVSAVAAAAPVATPASVRVRSSTSKLKAALVVTAGCAALFFGVAKLIEHGGDAETDLRAMSMDLDKAKALAGVDVDKALAEFDRLARAPSDGIRRAAKSESEYWKQRIHDAGIDVAALERRAPSLDAEAVASELALFRQKYGAGILARHAGLIERLEALRRDASDSRSKAAVAKSRDLADHGKLAEALAVWDTFLAEAIGDEGARRVAEEERVAIEAKAIEAFKSLAAEADAIAVKEGPRAASMRLHARLPDFNGTSSATAIALRIAALDGEAVAAATAAAAALRASAHRTPTTGPKASPSSLPTKGPTAGPATGPAPTPTAPQAPELPSPSAVNRARIVALLADADAQAASRKFREALGALVQAEPFAEGTADAAKIVARKDDLDLARRGIDLLCAAIKEHPERFSAVEIGPRYVVSLVDADSELVTAAVRGGKTQTRWASFDAAHTALLVEAAAVPAKDALPLAALLREVGNRDAEERVLLRVVEGGGDKAAVDQRLARWRSEPVPAGGYVPYEGRLVAPAERDRLALEARIAVACVKVASPNAKDRKGAYDELLSLGASAKEAFGKALRTRREAACKEIASAKAFTSGRTKQRLLEELEKRRAAALALIDDPVAYPYPYAPDQDQRQKRVDDLVDAVREVWDRPFELVMTWDKSVEESLVLVREVDDVLAKVEEGYVADLDAVKAEVNKSIGVPAMVFDAYDKDVLAFNEKVATSGTGQEKENVRLVNRYRMMMGRQAVKIDERLMRGARGHSIEMRTKPYFEHASPTPGLESPGKRCAREGYSSGVSENIAMSSGDMTAQGAFDGWYHSSGHHRNMLGKGHTDMGVGRSSGPAGTYWTQNFGSMSGKSLKAPDPLPPPRADVAPEKEEPAPSDPNAPSGQPPPDDGKSGG